MRTILFALLMVAFPLSAFAGGTTYKAQLKSFLWEGEGNFKIELEFLEKPALADVKAGEAIIVKLRHEPVGLLQKHLNRSNTTKQDFRKAINELLRLYRMKQPFSFGLMAGGLVPVTDEPGYFQSNALEVIDGVVYSFE